MNMLVDAYRFAAGPPPVTYAAWNPSDKSLSVNLSNANLTAVSSTGIGSYKSVRADTPFSQDCYYEINGNTSSTADPYGMGVATAALVLDSLTDYAGHTTTSSGLWVPSNEIYFNDAIAVNGSNSPINTDLTWMFAWKHSTREFWAGIVGVGWLQGDPALGTSPCATLTAGTYFPAATFYLGGVPITANFGATAFAGSVPSGFAAGVY